MDGVLIDVLIFASALSCLFVLHLDIHRSDRYHLFVPLFGFTFLGFAYTSLVLNFNIISARWLIIIANGICGVCAWKADPKRSYRSSILRVSSAGFLLGTILFVACIGNNSGGKVSHMKFKMIDNQLMMPFRDPYEVVGVEPSYSVEQIDAVFFQKALSIHPGRFADQGDLDRSLVFRDTLGYLKLREAYGILADPVRRALLDEGEDVSRGIHLISDAHLNMDLEDEDSQQSTRALFYSTRAEVWELDSYVTLPDADEILDSVLLPYLCGSGVPIYFCWDLHDLMKDGEEVADYVRDNEPELWETCSAGGVELSEGCDLFTENMTLRWLLRKYDRLRKATKVQRRVPQSTEKEFRQWYREYLLPARRAAQSSRNERIYQAAS